MKDKKIYSSLVPKISIYIWIIIALIMAIMFHDKLTGWIAIILIVPMITYIILNNIKRKKNIISFIENLTFRTNLGNRDSLLKFPIPLVLVDVS